MKPATPLEYVDKAIALAIDRQIAFLALRFTRL